MNEDRQCNRALLASKAVIAVFVVLVGVLGWQVRHFTIDASANTLLVKDNRHYLRTQQANQLFSPPEFVLIAFEPDDGEIFSAASKQVLQNLSADLQQVARVKEVNSLLNVPVFANADSLFDGIDVQSLTWANNDFSADEMRRLLSNHPLYEDLLFNQEQTAISLQVVFTEDKALSRLQARIVALRAAGLNGGLNEEQQRELQTLQEQEQQLTDALDRQRYRELTEIKSVVDQYDSQGRFYLGGGSLLAFELIDIIRSDLQLFGVAVSLIVCAIIYLLFRELRWVFLIFITCAAGVAMTLGLLGAFDLRVTVISANVVALQIVLTLALTVHLIVQYLELKSDHPEQTHAQWVVVTLQKKFKPCFYAGLTTSIGFGSLIFSGIQPIISFGWMMVLAMAMTLLVSLLLFPSLLLLFFGKTQSSLRDPVTEKFMRFCIDLVLHRSGWIAVFWALITVGGIAGCLRLSAENSFLNYFRDSTQVRRELTFIDQHFGGSTPLDVIYDIPPGQRRESLVVSADTVQTVEKIQRFLAAQRGVGNITSVADFTRIAQTVLGKPLTEYELTALYNTLDEDLKTDLFSSYFSPQTQQLRISARIQDATPGLDRERLFAQIKQGIADLGINAENIQFTNLFVLYQDIIQRLVDSQWMTLLIVYAVMAVVLVIIFLSFKIALIALIPNMVTTAFVMGLMGFLGIPLDLMTITIAAVAMGISVDDTIHYIHRFIAENSKSPAQAVRNSHLSVGYAVTYTTVIIVIGFSSLMFSDFMPSVYFGMLTGAAMLVALGTDVTLLPWLLNRFVRRESRESSSVSSNSVRAIEY